MCPLIHQNYYGRIGIVCRPCTIFLDVRRLAQALRRMGAAAQRRDCLETGRGSPSPEPALLPRDGIASELAAALHPTDRALLPGAGIASELIPAFELAPRRNCCC